MHSLRLVVIVGESGGERGLAASARRVDEPEKPARFLAMEEALTEVAGWVNADLKDKPVLIQERKVRSAAK